MAETTLFLRVGHATLDVCPTSFRWRARRVLSKQPELESRYGNINQGKKSPRIREERLDNSHRF